MHKGRLFPQALHRWKMIDCAEPYFLPRQCGLTIFYGSGPFDFPVTGYSFENDDDPHYLTALFDFPNADWIDPSVTVSLWLDGTNELLARGQYIDINWPGTGHWLFFSPWDYSVNDFFNGWYFPTYYNLYDVPGPLGPAIENQFAVDWYSYPQIPGWQTVRSKKRRRQATLGGNVRIETAARFAASRALAERKSLGRHKTT